MTLKEALSYAGAAKLGEDFKDSDVSEIIAEVHSGHIMFVLRPKLKYMIGNPCFDRGTDINVDEPEILFSEKWSTEILCSKK